MKDSKKLLERIKVNKYNLVSMPGIDLTPEEADQFIDYVVDQSAMKNFARVKKMNKPSAFIRAIGFGDGDFLFPAGAFNESKYKKKFAQNKITLNTYKMRGAVVVFDDDLEENIEGAKFKDHLMKIVTAKIANQLELAYYMAESSGGNNNWPADDIKSLFDGWRYIITHSQAGEQYYNDVSGGAHIKDACDGGESGSEFEKAGEIAEYIAAEYRWEFKYHQMVKNMPSIYKANNGLEKMRFLNSDLVSQDYIEALQSRGTALGDAVLQGKVPTSYGKVGIIDVPLMPTTLGDPDAGDDGKVGAGEYTDVLLTPKDNLIIGMQREIRIESQREAADEATYVFYSIKTGCTIENVNACVLLRCLEHGC